MLSSFLAVGIHGSGFKYFYRVKSGNLGHRVNSDIHLQTVEIQMRRLLMSRLIRIFTVCLVNLVFIPFIRIWNKPGRCPNLDDCPNLSDFTLSMVLDLSTFISPSCNMHTTFSNFLCFVSYAAHFRAISINSNCNYESGILCKFTNAIH